MLKIFKKSPAQYVKDFKEIHLHKGASPHSQTVKVPYCPKKYDVFREKIGDLIPEVFPGMQAAVFGRNLPTGTRPTKRAGNSAAGKSLSRHWPEFPVNWMFKGRST